MKVIYPPCKKCGASHSMGIEDMETGNIEPLDICYKCLWFGTLMPIETQVKISEEN